MMDSTVVDVDPMNLLTQRRAIDGISAVLLPHDSNGVIHWDDFEKLLRKTAESGLTPAVNMDTGYVNLLTLDQRRQVLDRTREVLAGGRFVAGAFVDDDPGATFDLSSYCQAIESIQSRDGTPIIFQSYGLTDQPDDKIAESYREIGRYCDQFLAFELGSMFAPFGKIYSLEVFGALMEIGNCQGAKHSSLDRTAEWQRLALRDRTRAEFRIYTGNDLAIDMVMYGSDYLLGLSTMAPDFFATRDRYWREGDSRFFRLNDILQFLGQFAFRDPTPAYKHSAAMFLKLRRWIESESTPASAAQREASDRQVLQTILNQLMELDESTAA